MPRRSQSEAWVASEVFERPAKKEMLKNPRWNKKIDYDYDNDNDNDNEKRVFFGSSISFLVGAVGYRPAFGRNLMPEPRLGRKKGAWQAPRPESGS